MNNFPISLVDRLWVAFIGISFIVSIGLILLFVAAFKNNNVYANSIEPTYPSQISSSPNVVTNSMALAGNELSHAVDATIGAIDQSIQSTGSATISGARTTASTVATVATLIGRGILTGSITTARVVRGSVISTGKVVAKGIGAVGSIPSKTVNYITNSTVVSSFIRPSEYREAPILDPDSPELLAAIKSLPPANTKSTKAGDSDPAWPIRGGITTQFGVPHWPYQRVHTGLDISDHAAPGVTKIKPFRPGKVIEVIYSRYGYGNHVIIDHGNNVTSLYAHMATILVEVGQDVDKSTSIGTEGSTGMSTGTHLHFEIRVNGQAADPHKFIEGSP